ncbi:MAG TPA: PA14 domain-containing protein [Anaerolineae bacterium]|nr:PA14 domain-containing protein [Anaerolineae bacterium]
MYLYLPILAETTMQNKAYRQLGANIWLALYLFVILLTGCSPAEPPTAAPTVPAEATPIAFTPSTSPLSTPSRTATPAPTKPTPSPTPTTTPSPDSLISEGDTMPSLSPIASPTPGTPRAVFIVPCVVGPDTLQLRSGPDSSYVSIKTLPVGTTLSALKYTTDGLWLLVETKQGEAGWVNATAVSCQGDLSRLPVAEGVSPPTPTTSLAAAPSPTPALPTWTPVPAASPTLPPPSPASWRGEYFNNPNLAGEPVLVRDDPALDFNWVSGSPGPNIPADNFSVRWTRPFEFAEEGDYRFLADVDDGVKLYLDGWLIIDEWNTNPYVLHSGVFADVKPGVHTIMVEYFEAGGDAHAKVWFEKTIVSSDKWVGEYYNNPDFRDAPFLVREDNDIDFNWDNDEPASGMNDDNFSVRWQRTVVLEAGDYNFEAQLAEEDRVKIYLDNWLILEEDSENGGTVTGSFKDVGAGTHTLKVEYQEYSGQASIEVNWDRDD